MNQDSQLNDQFLANTEPDCLNVEQTLSLAARSTDTNKRVPCIVKDQAYDL